MDTGFCSSQSTEETKQGNHEIYETEQTEGNPIFWEAIHL